MSRRFLPSSLIWLFSSASCRLGLVEDEVVEKVYLENLYCGYKGSDVKAEALCLLLELLFVRWDMDPASRNIDVERYIRSLLDCIERCDPPSTLVDEIRVGPYLIMVTPIFTHGTQGRRCSIWRQNPTVATLVVVGLLRLKPSPPWVIPHPPLATELLFKKHRTEKDQTPTFAHTTPPIER